MPRNGPIRDQRRRELIRATIAVIARRGYSGTTVARVAAKARVSVGLMNFHFSSKDRLFRETFNYLSEEYDQTWQRNLDAARGDPMARLKIMIESYFDPRIFTREKLAVWFTFWSDAELRDRYRAAATRLEHRYLDALEKEIDRLAKRHGPQRQPKAIVAGLSAMIDGYWLQALLEPRRFERALAVAACQDFLEMRLRPSPFAAAPPRRRTGAFWTSPPALAEQRSRG
jgi:TetR/AcrR family transcriptional regulator, transcriptional repressor of bet genes